MPNFRKGRGLRFYCMCLFTTALIIYPSRMPELAEVDYYRRQWDPGVGNKVLRVFVHHEKRDFRGCDPLKYARLLIGQTLDASDSRGKWMLFRFSGSIWMGIHLGMTGKLTCAAADFSPGKHDHMVIYQRERSLVFTDMRLFGRVLFDKGSSEPEWWTEMSPSITSDAFTLSKMQAFLNGHQRLPVKAALLLQKGFPGVGNWMADEILWRARVYPGKPVKQLTGNEMKILWKSARSICRIALEQVGEKGDDPPAHWLFHARWGKGGKCPKHSVPLERATIGGRTTAWCPKCQGY